MSNNKRVKDYIGEAYIVKTTEDAQGINVPHVNVDSANNAATRIVNQALSALGSCEAPIGDIDGVGFQILGTFVGTLVFEASMDNKATWLSIGVLPVGAGSISVPVSSVTAPGNWETAGGAYTHVRVRMSVYTSGTANITITATNGQRLVRISSAVSIGGIIDAKVSNEVTRPNDTTAYVAGAVLNNSKSAATQPVLANVARGIGTSGYLKLVLLCSNSAATARIRVHLYDSAPSTPKIDGAAWALDYNNDKGKYLGYVDLDALSGGVASTTMLQPYKANASKDLPYEMQLLDAMTPLVNTKYTLMVVPDQNNV